MALLNHHLCWGINYVRNNKNLIDVPNTGLITDVLLVVHELSHYRDRKEKGREQVCNLMTESLAYTEELICTDYLSELGYEDSMNLWRKIVFTLFYRTASDIIPMYKVFILFKKYGDISKETYKQHFKKDDDYEKVINYISDLTEQVEMLQKGSVKNGKK